MSGVHPVAEAGKGAHALRLRTGFAAGDEIQTGIKCMFYDNVADCLVIITTLVATSSSICGTGGE